MPVIVALIVIAVLLVGALTGALVWAATNRPGALDGETLSEPESSAAHTPLPAVVTAGAVDDLRFDQALRGYSMREVDAAVDRLRDEIAARDEEITRLRVELDVARAAKTGELELGHGPVIRPRTEQSLWTQHGRDDESGAAAR